MVRHLHMLYPFSARSTLHCLHHPRVVLPYRQAGQTLGSQWHSHRLQGHVCNRLGFHISQTYRTACIRWRGPYYQQPGTKHSILCEGINKYITPLIIQNGLHNLSKYAISLLHQNTHKFNVSFTCITYILPTLNIMK